MSDIHVDLRLPRMGRSLTLSAIALCTACASGPNWVVEDARQAYTQARLDPEIERHAPATLDEAERLLQQAERAEADQATERAEHWAYLTKQQVQIARSEAREKTIESQATTQAKSEVQQLAREMAELKAQRTERGYVITLGDVLFDTGLATLTPGAQQDLYQLVTFLRRHPDQTVLIEGHTDSMGSDSYNLDLSQRRAFAVHDFLVRNGIGPERIMARGFGESMPVASNDTGSGRQQNRRVEIVFPATSRAGIAGR